MNTYRFKIPHPYAPQYFYQRLPNVEAAREYADKLGYELMRHADPTKQFLADCGVFDMLNLHSDD